MNGVANRVVRGLIEDEAALSRVTVALMREVYEEARGDESGTGGTRRRRVPTVPVTPGGFARAQASRSEAWECA